MHDMTPGVHPPPSLQQDTRCHEMLRGKGNIVRHAVKYKIKREWESVVLQDFRRPLKNKDRKI